MNKCEFKFTPIHREFPSRRTHTSSIERHLNRAIRQRYLYVPLSLPLVGRAGDGERVEWTHLFVAQRCRRPWSPILFSSVIMIRLYVHPIWKRWMMPLGSMIISLPSLSSMSSTNWSRAKRIVSFNSSLHPWSNYWRWVKVRSSSHFFNPSISSRNDFFSCPSMTTLVWLHSPVRIGHCWFCPFEVGCSTRSDISLIQCFRKSAVSLRLDVFGQWSHRQGDSREISIILSSKHPDDQCCLSSTKERLRLWSVCDRHRRRALPTHTGVRQWRWRQIG